MNGDRKSSTIARRAITILIGYSITIKAFARKEIFFDPSGMRPEIGPIWTFPVFFKDVEKKGATVTGNTKAGR